MSSFEDAFALTACSEESSNIITLYHGTKDINFKPNYNFKNPNNDYGSGLYTTPDLELAKEWAMSVYTKGDRAYVFSYELDLTGLNIINLHDEYDFMCWLAVTILNRPVSELGPYVGNMLEKFINTYSVDTSSADLVIGWRVDDSYYKFVRDFVSFRISAETLECAVKLGNLGLQYMIKSEKAFNRLKFIESIEVDKSYAELFVKRNKEAAENYLKLKKKGFGSKYLHHIIGE